MSYRDLFVKLGNIVVLEEIALVEGNKGLNSGFQMFNFYSFYDITPCLVQENCFSFVFEALCMWIFFV